MGADCCGEANVAPDLRKEPIKLARKKNDASGLGGAMDGTDLEIEAADAAQKDKARSALEDTLGSQKAQSE